MLLKVLSLVSNYLSGLTLCCLIFTFPKIFLQRIVDNITKINLKNIERKILQRSKKERKNKGAIVTESDGLNASQSFLNDESGVIMAFDLDFLDRTDCILKLG